MFEIRESLTNKNRRQIKRISGETKRRHLKDRRRKKTRLPLP